MLLVTGELPPREDLKTWWRSTDTHWPGLSEYSVLRITAAAVTAKSGERDLSGPVRKTGPKGEVRNRMDDFRKILARHGLQCNGLVFPHTR